ncbi:MAG: monovalent cation/H(+) antiporter subunit G [Candidatus Omnitrophica bacterium]|nr:monovalent cation/H(+) antiporter subunit G [Candidatus Omnitrophota bacterium]
MKGVKSVADIITTIFLSAGLIFFIGGVLGLIRFPDIYTRLHALTKADNIGLGFIIAGLLFQTYNPAAAVKMAFIWLLIVFSSATICYLIGHAARTMGIKPWRKP